MGRDLEPSIMSLLAGQGVMTAEEIAETLESAEESVIAKLQQLKSAHWVVEVGDGRWRAASAPLG